MVRKVTVFRDGVRASIQASRSHYCTPRTSTGPYYSVEVGYIEDADGKAVKAPKGWGEYAEWYKGCGYERRDAAIFGWVPYYCIMQLAHEHGGIVVDNLPPLVEFRNIINVGSGEDEG